MCLKPRDMKSQNGPWTEGKCAIACSVLFRKDVRLPNTDSDTNQLWSRPSLPDCWIPDFCCPLAPRSLPHASVSLVLTLGYYNAGRNATWYHRLWWQALSSSGTKDWFSLQQVYSRSTLQAVTQRSIHSLRGTTCVCLPQLKFLTVLLPWGGADIAPCRAGDPVSSLILNLSDINATLTILERTAFAIELLWTKGYLATLFLSAGAGASTLPLFLASFSSAAGDKGSLSRAANADCGTLGDWRPTKSCLASLSVIGLASVCWNPRTATLSSTLAWKLLDPVCMALRKSVSELLALNVVEHGFVNPWATSHGACFGLASFGRFAALRLRAKNEWRAERGKLSQLAKT